MTLVESIKSSAIALEAMQVMSTWSTLPIQTSLKINEPNDKYEQEADRVAEQVMHMAEAQVQRKTCPCGQPVGSGGTCAACKKRELGIQRMASGSVPQAPAPPIVHQVLQQSGRPLDGPTRNFMESRFGQDFGQVRVHTDMQAAASAQAVNARAYTVGQNVVFGAKQFSPRTGWKSYHGSTGVFHCGYRGILEDRSPSLDDLQN